MPTLALTLVLVAGKAFVLCPLPGPGSYYVEASNDGCAWTVVASGYVAEQCVAMASEPTTTTIRIYRVEWREKGK